MSSDFDVGSDHKAPSETGAETRAETRAENRAETERTGIYWKPSVWALARSAYVADLDHDPGSPGAFVSWLGRALEQHAARTPAQRVAISKDPQLRDLTGAGVNQSHPLRVRTIELVKEAVIADRGELGRVVSRSAFAAEAVVAAAQTARERLGRPLPPPPARLSNRPPLSRPRRRVPSGSDSAPTGAS